MPNYVFRCKNPECDLGEFDVFHSVLEPHPTKCPECGKPIVRVFSKPNILYRGAGFFTTDRKLSEPTEDEIIEDKLYRILAGKSED